MICGYLGCAFDLLNVGDLDVIAQARQRCDRLVIGVQTDDDVRRRTGREPVVPFEERIELVRHVRGVDAVVAHADDAVDGCQVVFAVTGSADADWDDHETADDQSGAGSGQRVHWIVPRRTTASREVRAALAPVAGAA